MPKTKTGVGRGAKPIPTEIKRLRGNVGHQKLPDAPTPETALAVVELGVIPPAPDWCDEFGRAVWIQLWNAGRRYVSEEHDMVLMCLLVEKLQLGQRLRKHLGDDIENRFYMTANGQIVTHPVVKQIDQCDAQITAWLQLLGFPVSERARLGLFEIRVADKLDQYRARNKKRDANIINIKDSKKTKKPVKPVASKRTQADF